MRIPTIRSAPSPLEVTHSNSFAASSTRANPHAAAPNATRAASDSAASVDAASGNSRAAATEPATTVASRSGARRGLTRSRSCRFLSPILARGLDRSGHHVPFREHTSTRAPNVSDGTCAPCRRAQTGQPTRRTIGRRRQDGRDAVSDETTPNALRASLPRTFDGVPGHGVRRLYLLPRMPATAVSTTGSSRSCNEAGLGLCEVFATAGS